MLHSMSTLNDPMRLKHALVHTDRVVYTPIMCIARTVTLSLDISK